MLVHQKKIFEKCAKGQSKVMFCEMADYLMVRKNY